MPTSSLSLSLADIRQALALHLGWSLDASKWTENQKAQSLVIIRDGLHQFYSPPILPGEPAQHEWTFLSPWAHLSVQANVFQYDLPEDFAGITDDLTFRTDSAGYCPIRLVSDVKIRQLRQGAGDITGYPYMAAVVPSVSDGSRPQVWTIVFYPTPDASYEFHLRYHSNPNNLSDFAPFPLGGVQAAAALQASVLAAAELALEDTKGVRYADFMEKLRAAIAADRQRNVTSLGYCGDGDTAVPYERDFVLTYNGTEL